MTKPLLAYYGDDFTGSADVMEVLQWAGLRTVLFLQPPSPDELAAFENLRAFGVAGWSRTMSPTEMDDELLPVFRKLRESEAAIVHYKTCSTADSSPEIGSIGKAMELGRSVFDLPFVPVILGAPELGRYQVFGNLYARSGLDSEPYRLDRHPTMRNHPVTPMTEADMRVHLAKQTDLKIKLIDVLELNEQPSEFKGADSEVLLFDAFDSTHMRRIGEWIEELHDSDSPIFVVGSSGVEYALSENWSHSNRLDEIRSHSPGRPSYNSVDQLLVLTGSCSPVNERQIAKAQAAGFELVEIKTERLAIDNDAAQESDRVIKSALECLDRQANVILHSALGPQDDRVKRVRSALVTRGFDDLDIRLRSGRLFGPQFGRILKGILTKRKLKRVAVAGGDTSGYVARELGITALEAIAPVAPGSPLCRVHSPNDLHEMEFFFKGGQVGKDDVWDTILNGTN